MITYHDQYVILIEYFYVFHYFSETRFFIQCSFGYRDFTANGVADKHRLYKTQPVIALGEGFGINLRGRLADGYTEDKGAMSDPLLKGLGLTPLGVHMVRKEVACLARVHNDIRFGNGPAQTDPAVAYLIVFVKLLLYMHNALVAELKLNVV